MPSLINPDDDDTNHLSQIIFKKGDEMRGRTNRSSDGSNPLRKTALQERLKDIVLLELREDG